MKHRKSVYCPFCGKTDIKSSLIVVQIIRKINGKRAQYCPNCNVDFIVFTTKSDRRIGKTEEQLNAKKK